MNFIKNFFKFLSTYFKAIFLIAFIIWLFTPAEELSEPYNLAKVSIRGDIMDSSETVQRLLEIYEDDSIKGVLINIDSGGGSMSASVEIAEMVKRVASKKAVVSYASGTFASGSYYSAIWSNLIITNRASLVGSIGVIFDGINYKELAEKVGVFPQVAKAGDFKESGTASREWLPHERAEIERVVKESYNMFVSDVALARNLDINSSNDWANAHIFTGEEALKLGLVDEVGTILEAQERVVELSGVQNPIWEKEDEVDKFFKSLSTKFAVELLYLFDYKLR
jgi:protease-4